MTTKGFRKAGNLPTLIAALVHFDVSFMVWVLLGALGAYVAEDLGLNGAQKGLMVALPPLGGAAFRLLLGPLADRVGIKRLGLITMSLTFVPLLWASVAGGTYVQILGIGFLLGIAGASFAVALPLASRWYPPEYQGLALGIAGAGNSGTVIAVLAAPRLAERYGWHAVFGLAAIPVAAAWLAFALLAKEPPRPANAPHTSGGVFGLLKDSDPRWLCAFYLVTFGGFVGLSGYLPIFYVDHFGVSKVVGAELTALGAISASLVRPFGGAVADRVGGTRVVLAVLLGAAGLATVLALDPVLPVTVGLLVAVMALLGLGNGAVFQLVGSRVASRVGAMTGLVGAAGGLGGFLLPFGFGVLTTVTGGFGVGFLVFAVIAFAAGLGARSRHRAWSFRPGELDLVGESLHDQSLDPEAPTPVAIAMALPGVER
jgi:Nitrate/nitrite transporter